MPDDGDQAPPPAAFEQIVVGDDEFAPVRRVVRPCVGTNASAIGSAIGALIGILCWNRTTSRLGASRQNPPPPNYKRPVNFPTLPKI